MGRGGRLADRIDEGEGEKGDRFNRGNGEKIYCYCDKIHNSLPQTLCKNVYII